MSCWPAGYVIVGGIVRETAVQQAVIFQHKFPVLHKFIVLLSWTGAEKEMMGGKGMWLGLGGGGCREEMRRGESFFNWGHV